MKLCTATALFVARQRHCEAAILNALEFYIDFMTTQPKRYKMRWLDCLEQAISRI